MDYTQEQLKEILLQHELWLNCRGGKKANFSGADLSGADLSGANLSGADLHKVDLSGADISEANLSKASLRLAKLRLADLYNANLSGTILCDANLSKANLCGANLSEADLSWADLSEADISGSNLSMAKLSDANLYDVNLSGANLFRVNLFGANLSGAIGIPKASDFLKRFDKTTDGYIVFKRIKNGYTEFEINPNWQIAPGLYIEENTNPNKGEDCGCGVNFGTLEWCKKNYQKADLWKCLLEFDDVADLIVPYDTDGKARCNRLKLLEIIKE